VKRSAAKSRVPPFVAAILYGCSVELYEVSTQQRLPD
jgi:hypothetical protein